MRTMTRPSYLAPSLQHCVMRRDTEQTSSKTVKCHSLTADDAILASRYSNISQQHLLLFLNCRTLKHWWSQDSNTYPILV